MFYERFNTFCKVFNEPLNPFTREELSLFCSFVDVDFWSFLDLSSGSRVGRHTG